MRKFPYKARGKRQRAQVREAISQAIAGVEGMLWEQAHRQNAGQFDREVLEELVQACRIHLWQHSLPRYDATREARVSSFLHRCIRYYLIAAFRQLRSHKCLVLPAVGGEGGEDDALAAAVAKDESADEAVEIVAAAILESPRTISHAEVRRRLVDLDVQDLAGRCGDDVADRVASERLLERWP